MLDRAVTLGILFRKLRSIGKFTEEDQQALAAVPVSVKTFDAGQTILAEGERPTQCRILLSGWSYRVKALEDGRTQILAINIGGDLIDLQSLDMPRMDHSMTALTRVHVACISHQDMHALLTRDRRVASILWRSVLIEQAIARQWMLSLGRRTALERVAHLLCEIYARLNAVGLAEPCHGSPTFTMPLNQAQFAQIVGLSTVHMNRTIQALRGQGVLRWVRSGIAVLDPPRLQTLGGFDPEYLGLVSGSA